MCTHFEALDETVAAQVVEEIVEILFIAGDSERVR
jgi:hypothetical protein